MIKALYIVRQAGFADACYAGPDWQAAVAALPARRSSQFDLSYVHEIEGTAVIVQLAGVWLDGNDVKYTKMERTPVASR